MKEIIRKSTSELATWIKSNPRIRDIQELENIYSMIKADLLLRIENQDQRPLSILELNELKLLRDTWLMMFNALHGTRIIEERKITFEDIQEKFKEAKVKTQITQKIIQNEKSEERDTS